MRFHLLMIATLLAVPAASASAQAHGQAGHSVEGEAALEEYDAIEGQNDEAVAEEAHHELSIAHILHDKNFQAGVFNFLLLVFIIVYFGRGPIGASLANRKKAVEEGLKEAARLKEEAEAKKKEYTERLSKLEGELEQIRHEMVKAGEDERDRILAEAEKRASRLRKDTEFRIEQRLKELEEELTREAVEAAVGAAEKVLLEKTSADDQKRLAEAYLGRLGDVLDERKAAGLATDFKGEKA